MLLWEALRGSDADIKTRRRERGLGRVQNAEEGGGRAEGKGTYGEEGGAIGAWMLTLVDDVCEDLKLALFVLAGGARGAVGPDRDRNELDPQHDRHRDDRRQRHERE